MAVWSSLLRFTGQKIFGNSELLKKQLVETAQKRCMSGGERTFELTASRWQWHKTKDMFHLYTMIGAIPLGIATFYAYVFIGPATLEPIPEGYTPKRWEYFRNPIHRFMSRYFRNSPQQEYEKYLWYIHHADRQRKAVLLRHRIKLLMAENHDYDYWFYRPYDDLKYVYRRKELIDKAHQEQGLYVD